MTPRVTVVMPVFNGERFIGEAVASALASSFRDFEILVLDDGSTDGSLAAARRAAGGDARLRIVRLPHGGVAAARNAGLREARGGLIANLDSDDVMLPERLALQVAYLDSHPECVAVGGRSLVVDAAGTPLQVVGRLFTHLEIDAALLGGHGGSLGSDTAMFRKHTAQAIGGYEDKLTATGEDHDLWLRLAEVGRIANLPDVLTRYRVHDTNVSGGKDSQTRRLPVTLDNLARAFERRRITDRQPAKLPRPPIPRSEQWCDAGIVRYYSGNRIGALWRVLVAAALNPAAPATRSALRLMMSKRAPVRVGAP